MLSVTVASTAETSLCSSRFSAACVSVAVVRICNKVVDSKVG